MIGVKSPYRVSFAPGAADEPPYPRWRKIRLAFLNLRDQPFRKGSSSLNEGVPEERSSS